MPKPTLEAMGDEVNTLIERARERLFVAALEEVVRKYGGSEVLREQLMEELTIKGPARRRRPVSNLDKGRRVMKTAGRVATRRRT